MLILQRKEGESLLIGDEVEVTVLAVEAGRVRLAIQAPRDVTILRSELKVAAQANRRRGGFAPGTARRPAKPGGKKLIFLSVPPALLRTGGFLLLYNVKRCVSA